MRFAGRVFRVGRMWAIEVPILGVATQGRTKKESFTMIADAMGWKLDSVTDAIEPTAPASTAPAATVEPRTTEPRSATAEAPPPPAPRDRGDVELLGLIDRLSALLDRSDLTELEVEVGGTGLVLRKPAALAPAVAAAAPSPATSGVPSPLPQVAQPAIQGGHHVARQITRRLAGAPPEPFSYRDKGSMATIGRHDAVAEFPNGQRLHGVVGWLAWLGLHIVYLMGFRNRANVLVNWAWNYLTYDRASRLIAMVQTLLDFSSLNTRSAELALAAVDLGDVAGTYLRGRRQRLEQSGRHCTYLEPPTAVVGRGNEQRIFDILDRLVDNAVRFTPEGSNIAVTATWEEGAHGHRAVLAVADDGPGIEPDKLRRIFEPFEQADGSATRTYGGLGLGLAVARRHAEAMGGTLTAESVVGSGSKFFLRLPPA